MKFADFDRMVSVSKEVCDALYSPEVLARFEEWRKRKEEEIRVEERIHAKVKERIASGWKPEDDFDEETCRIMLENAALFTRIQYEIVKDL